MSFVYKSLALHAMTVFYSLAVNEMKPKLMKNDF